MTRSVALILSLFCGVAIAQTCVIQRPMWMSVNMGDVDVIWDGNDAQSMRAAMQVGARDFLSEPIVEEDLLAAVTRLTIESKPSRKAGPNELTVFINAKGGSGGYGD